LRDQHVRLSAGAIRFSFLGKSGQRHVVDIDNPRLARIVRRCRDVPGQELFQWLDAKGRRHRVSSTDVNRYLRAATGESFTAKDFRTWAGTVHALHALQKAGRHATQREAKRRVIEALSYVAALLGNTPAVCRKAYVDPRVVDAYLAGRLLTDLPKKQQRRAGLNAAEATALDFLQRHG
jgi:DNA topoisomerase-1